MKSRFLMAAILGGVLAVAGCGDKGGDSSGAASGQAQAPAPQTEQATASPAMSMPGGHPPASPGAEVDLTGIDPAPGGKTVAEVWAERAALVGGEVAVRGRVVKFLPGIMGKNWLHLRDGTGDQDTNDLTVTTQATVQVGDLITVRGKIAVDRDFGAGYRYQVIMEDAAVVP
ncbi:MAG: hypothetical protein RBT60_00460 [Candidatus Krumholzibacteria bacterium]|nr:hypothetical protein [Candidatus Krumholzibacteria bacterium]